MLPQIFTVLPPRMSLGFIASFLVFIYCVMFRKWGGLYVALPGMFASALAIAIYIFENLL